MPKKKRFKKWLSKSVNIALCGLIIAVFSLFFAITLPLIQNQSETSKKRNLIYVENIYNIGIVNTYKKTIENEDLDQKLFFNQFSVEIYKNNWDIILNLEPACAENLIRAIAKMDAINSINRSILTLYNQEGLIFEANQWKNTKERTAHWYTILGENLNELSLHLENLKECKF